MYTHWSRINHNIFIFTLQQFFSSGIRGRVDCSYMCVCCFPVNFHFRETDLRLEASFVPFKFEYKSFRLIFTKTTYEVLSAVTVKLLQP